MVFNVTSAPFPGKDLFSFSENFMTDLSAEDESTIAGGGGGGKKKSKSKKKSNKSCGCGGYC
jgi:hypothetical protein